MAFTQVGKGHIVGTATGAFGITSLSGYVSPKMDTLTLTNSADFTEEKNQVGEVDSVVCSNLGVECQFRVTPKGSSLANARLAAGLPAVGAGVTITGLPVIAMGGFTDVLNTDSGNTQPWIYTGQGSIEGTSDGKWSASITLRRYINITSATAIS